MRRTTGATKINQTPENRNQTMTTTWTTNKNGQHIAWHGKIRIGHVWGDPYNSNRLFLAVSENGLTKQFLILQHAKDWVEDLAIGIDETDFE